MMTIRRNMEEISAGLFHPATRDLTANGQGIPRTVHVIGAGGIGVVVGTVLTRAGWDVTMVETNAAKVEAGTREGMFLDGVAERRASFCPFNGWTPPEGALLLLCTKTYDNAAVLARISNRHWLVPIQNGFDPELDASPHPLEGIASFVSQCEPLRPATQLTRQGELHLGARQPLTAQNELLLEHLAAGLREGGWRRVSTVPAILPYKLSKLMYNAAISPLAAAAGIDNAGLLRDPLAQRLFFALLRENYAILRRAGAKFARIGPLHPRVVNVILRIPGLARAFAHFFRPSLEGTYCSMAPDMGRSHTEAGAYNGYLQRLARECGAASPMNAAVLLLLEIIRAEKLPPARTRLVELDRILAIATP